MVPLNWDLLTNLILTNIGIPAFQNFLGTLDAGGTATATLNTFGPLDPGLVGISLYFAYFMKPPPAWDFSSNAVEIQIGL